MFRHILIPTDARRSRLRRSRRNAATSSSWFRTDGAGSPGLSWAASRTRCWRIHGSPCWSIA